MNARGSALKWGGLVVAGLVLAGCTSAAPETAPVAPETRQTSSAGVSLTAGYDTSGIALIDSATKTVDGREWRLSYYVNSAYQCGRTGDFPFLVVEPSDSAGEDLPLWVMLHGGGSGYYDESGRYHGPEGFNDQESTSNLGSMLTRFTGQDGQQDTFIADRFRAGDRFVLGSLCDHDLMLGLGEPYPNNPRSADQTTDGLLANLAMLDAVRNGSAGVDARPTNQTWIIGTGAGSYGAYGLAHNLWLRDTPANGVILDSGILSTPKVTMLEAGVGKQADEGTEFQLEALTTKVGPYFADQELWLENTIAAGFDTPFILVSEVWDNGCGGGEDAPLLPEAQQAGYDTNCAWVQGAVQEAVNDAGDPITQQTHVYPGSTHTASDMPGTHMQEDLRAWYTAAGGR